VKRKWLKILAGALGIGILLWLAVFANSLVGNPVSRALVRRGASGLLAREHPGTDYTVGDVGFDFKSGGYWAHVQSPSSPDSAFSVYLDGLGRVRFDTYEEAVLRRGNTARRLDGAYREAAQAVLRSPAFPYALDIGFAQLEFRDSDYPYAIPPEELELDGTYDLAELGRRAGRLVIYFQDEDRTAERLAVLLPEVKARLEAAGVCFRGVDAVIRAPKPEDGSPWSEEQFNVLDFPAAEIDGPDLAERLAAADAAAKEYYARMDAETAALIPQAAHTGG